MAEPISKLQLKALQTMWSVKMRRAGISPSSPDARELRYQYIRSATAGRAAQTKELSHDDARRVLRLLARELGQIKDAGSARAAGTHGRRGYDDGRQPVLAGEQQFQMLRSLQGQLGWDQARLDGFIRRQLGRPEIRTMADLNRVIWPMKAMLRREKSP